MKTNHYLDYSTKDFVTDAYFIQWVWHPEPASNQFWEEWLKQHPHKEAEVTEAIRILRHLSINEDVMPPESLTRIRRRLDALFDEQQQSVRPRQRPLPDTGHQLRKLYRFAAVFAGFLLVLGAWWLMMKQPMTQYTTTYGETRTITLPDSSVVNLNANSTLRLASDWDEKAFREVWLEGEAFFSVQKKGSLLHAGNKIPFIVHTQNLNVRVLGTEFNVNNRRGQTAVVLSEGKVQLNSNQTEQTQSVFMKPGDYVSYSTGQKTFQSRSVNPNTYTAWTRNLLVFDNTPLSEVAQTIEDTYGLKVTLADARLASRKFTATLPSKSAQTVLTALSETFGVKVTRLNGQVIIEGH